MSTAVLSAEFERRAAVARGAVRADFGEGWMTAGARDMVRIAAFAGFDIPTLVQRVAMSTKHDGMTGVRLVERVMGDMDAESQEAAEARTSVVAVIRAAWANDYLQTPALLDRLDDDEVVALWERHMSGPLAPHLFDDGSDRAQAYRKRGDEIIGNHLLRRQMNAQTIRKDTP